MPKTRLPHFVLACLLLVATHASALRLDLVPAAPTITVGSPVQLSLVMSGLTALDQIISSWSLGLTFDTGVLSLGGFTFGTALGTGGDVIEGMQPDPGILSLFSVSLLSDAALEALQGDSVTLGVVTLFGLAPGIGSVGFDDGDFGLEFTGAAVNGVPAELVPDLGGARIEVLPRNTTPAPATLALLVLGGAAAFAFRRRA